MSYEIRKSDGTVIVTLADGVADSSSSSLTLIGRNVSNFGKAQNENILHLLENFASNIEPANKLTGQAWYDTESSTLKFNNGGAWESLATLDYSSTIPTASHTGYFWFDSSKNQLYINKGDTSNDFLLVGPENTPGYGNTKITSTTLKSTLNHHYPVLEITVGDEVVGVISTASFFVDSSNSIDGFIALSRGINFKNPTTNEFALNGRSFYSNLATTATNINAGTAGAVPYQSAPGLTTFVSIGSANTVLYSNGSAPTWKSLDSITSALATTATNLVNGAQGSLPYQTGAGATSFVALGTTGYILTAGATRPTWTNPAAMTIAYAGTATHAVRSDFASTSTTQAITSKNNSIATTEFVHNILPTGMVMMWSGIVATIPAGWSLCDGTNGTPNLLDRFIVGAGNSYIPSTTGGSTSTSVSISAAGGHDHDGNSGDHILTTAEIPNHGHLFDDIKYSESNGVRSYNDPMLGTITLGPSQGSASTDYDNGAIFVTHGTYKTGDDGAHSHTISSDGSHIHSASHADIIPPYFALCYIMKTS